MNDTLCALLDANLPLRENKTAMIWRGGSNTFAGIETKSLSVAQGLHKRGLRPGNRVGLPDEEKGELSVAFLVARGGPAVSEGEILRFCRERLAAYKVPKKVEFVNELPRNSAGKVLKRLLRDSAPGRENDHHVSEP